MKTEISNDVAQHKGNVQQANAVPQTLEPKKPTSSSPLDALAKPAAIKTIGTFTRHDDGDTTKGKQD